MKALIPLALASLLAIEPAHAAVISALSGDTSLPQTQIDEWFSRYAQSITADTLSQLSQASVDLASAGLKATSDTVQVTYLGTGAARDSNLFLAYSGSGSFDTASFWSQIYASGGTNNLDSYNPVDDSNQLFSTREGCSYVEAKAGNSCTATQVGMTRTITGLTAGDNLVFGLQALPLTYNADGISLTSTNYFFSGDASTNSDSQGWADGTVHTRVIQLDADTVLVAFEDTWSGSQSDYDYNDMIFIFQGVTSAVPEPAPLALAGIGLLLLPWWRRRRPGRA
ncbi:DUF4114 domain-containing protein [Pseudaeromonas sp. ZJS20]|uniref:DUF4114 domain-containing protein n=1 Tax=Pseudaeromonas aegiceratis TaxID=3153928 RepID=UPI00390C9624